MDRQQQYVARQDAELALGGAGGDGGGLALPDRTIRGDELDLQWHGRLLHPRGRFVSCYKPGRGATDRAERAKSMMVSVAW